MNNSDGDIEVLRQLCREVVNAEIGLAEFFERCPSADSVTSPLLVAVITDMEDAVTHTPGTLTGRLNLKRWNESDLKWRAEVDQHVLEYFGKVSEDALSRARNTAVDAFASISSDQISAFLGSEIEADGPRG